MSDKNKEHFNNLYSSKRDVFGGGKPLPIIQDVLKYKKSGKVLDIGGGDGRNSIFLAKEGFEVEIVDVSEIGLKRAQENAKEQGLNIKTEVADISEGGIKENYDVIIISFVFHLIKKERAQNLLTQVKKHTNGEGLNVIASFTKEGDFYKENPGVKSYYFNLGELNEIYKDWNILHYEEKELEAITTRSDGSPMFNTTAFLLAQKQK